MQAKKTRELKAIEKGQAAFEKQMIKFTQQHGKKQGRPCKEIKVDKTKARTTKASQGRHCYQSSDEESEEKPVVKPIRKPGQVGRPRRKVESESSSEEEDSDSEEDEDENSSSQKEKPVVPDAREAAKLRRITEMFQKQSAKEERQRLRREQKDLKRKLLDIDTPTHKNFSDDDSSIMTSQLNLLAVQK